MKNENFVCYTNNGKKLVLTNLIGQGGEGKIFALNNQYVIKIYNDTKKGSLSEIERKINVLISKNIDNEYICFPRHLVYDKDKKFVGYAMNRVKGYSLGEVYARGYTTIKKFFPNWTKLDIVDVCIKILNIFEILHKNRIFVGDINLNNILIDEKTNVFFIDCDSYQVDKFSCPVGTFDFTPPELQGVSFETMKQLRNLQNENYSISVLLFKLLMNNKNPNAVCGGSSDMAENIKRYAFPYRLEQTPNPAIPKGNWATIWYYIPKPIKELFLQNFYPKYERFSRTNRVTPTMWLVRFQEYKKFLEQNNHSNSKYKKCLEINPN